MQALKKTVVDARWALKCIGLPYYEPGTADEENAYLEPLPAAAGAGRFLVGVTVLIRPFASKVNSSMLTERRKEFPFESSLV